MRARLLRSMVGVAVLAVMGFGAPLALAVQARYRDLGLLSVQEAAARAVIAVPADFVSAGDLPELPTAFGSSQVGLYGPSGRLLVGSGPATAPAEVRTVLASGVQRSDRGALTVVMPVQQKEKVVGAVLASLPASVVAHQTYRAWALMAGLAVLVVAGTGAVAVDRSRRLSAPLAMLRGDAEVIGGGGGVDVRRPSGVAEIDDVHDALATAARRLNGALARERSFAADVAHQLRTPLASLRLALETAQLRGEGDDEVLEAALTDVDRLQQTLDDLLALNREEEHRRERQAPAALVDQAVDRWRRYATTARRDVESVVQPDLPSVRASAAAVRQILDVMISNAMVHGAGRVRVAARRAGAGVVLSVTDEGTRVIDPEEVFRRRGPSASGTGIGLALARRLAEAEGMELVVGDAGPGARFDLVVVAAPMDDKPHARPGVQ